MKARDLDDIPFRSSVGFESRWLLLGLVNAEVGLAAWLISGVRRRAAWGVTLIAWSVFTLVALYKTVSGADSCGCFGRIIINPLYTLVLDTAVMVALLVCKPPPSAERSQVRPLAGAAAAVILFVGVAWTVFNLAKAPPSANSFAPGMIESGGTVFLEPALWIGRPLPLMDSIDLHDDLRHGKWICVLHRADCHVCQQAIPQYVQWSQAHPEWKLMLIELSGEPHAVGTHESAIIGKLDQSKAWFATTPIVLRIDDGSVVAVTTGEAAKVP